MKVTFGFFKQGNLYKIAAGDDSDNPNNVVGYGKFLKYDSVDNEYVFAEHALIEGNWENTYNYIREFEPSLMQTIYKQDRSQKHYLKFFAKGEKYKFLVSNADLTNKDFDRLSAGFFIYNIIRSAKLYKSLQTGLKYS